MSDDPHEPNESAEQPPSTRITIDLAERLGGIDDPRVLAAVGDAIKQAVADLQKAAAEAPPAEPNSPPPEPRPAVENQAIEAAAEQLEKSHRKRAEELQRQVEERHEEVADLANRVLAITDRRAWWANVLEWLLDITTPVNREVSGCYEPFTMSFKLFHHSLKKLERGAAKDEDVNVGGS